MKIGLALSGGGALGAAHIAVLEELEKHSLKLDVLSGSSAGSIIAAVYANGGLENLGNFFKEISSHELFKIKSVYKLASPNTFFNEVFSIISRYIPSGFEDLEIPLKITVTNFETGKSEVIETGNLVSAIKASCAYPGVFPPQTINGQFFIDGGVTRNLPSDCLKKECDFLIGSSIYSVKNLNKTEPRKMNRIKIVSRTLDILEKELSEFLEKECDFCFKIDVGIFKWYSFSKVHEILKIARVQARVNFEDLGRIIQSQP